MFEGRVVNYDRLELKLDITGVSVTDLSVGRAEYSVSGQLICWQALAPTGTESELHTVGTETANWVKNIWMQAETTHSGSVWSFQWLERGITTSGTGAGAVRLEIDDYRLYARKEGTWRLRIGESRLYVGTSLIATYASTTIDSTETVSPRTRPVFSIPPEGVALATAVNAINVTEAAAAGFSYTSEVTVSGTVVAGWRYIDNGETVTLPVFWSTPNTPTLSGVTASLPAMVGATTWTAGLEVYAYEKREDNWCSDGPGSVLPRPYITNEQRSGRWWVWPVLDRSVHRMATVSEALVVRGGFPAIQSRGTKNTYLSGSFFEDLPGTTASAVSTPTYAPEHTEFLEVVGNPIATIEEPFTQSLYSPVRLAGSYAEAGTVELSQAWGGTLPAACSSPDWRTGRLAKSSSVQWIDAYAVQTRGDAVLLTANPDIIASYTHDEPMARMFTTWFCPHWQYALWFPPNTIDTDADTIPDAQDVWQVFTTDTPVEYWLDSRQQYIKHPSLSGSERRNVIVTEPLINSIWQRGGTGITKVWQTHYGLPTSPWGISRFEAQIPTVPASVTLDSGSASLWSGLLNCTVTAAGASVVATPSGAGDIEVALDYAAFQTEPYLFAAMSAQFRMNWVTTNVTTCAVFAEGWDGDRVELVPNADRNTWKDWPLDGSATKFAGSWEQEFGRGYITDTGADVDADGISSATMGDVLRAHVFGLLPGRTCRRIVYVITPASVANVTIEFPEFRHTSHKYIPEIAQQGVFISPNGPGVRFGNATWWDVGGDVFTDPPDLVGPANMPTVLDGLVSRRVYFEGVASTDGLNTEIANIYESGVEYTTVRKHQAVDPTDGGQSCHSFWVQALDYPVLGLVSSLREIPPDAAFPVRDRDFNYQTTSDWVQKTWTAHFRDRYYTSASLFLRLFDGVTEITGLDPFLSVPGWKIYSHSVPVTNEEGLFEYQGPQSVVWGEQRPWHGTFAVIYQSPQWGGSVSSDAHADGRHFRATLYDGEVLVEHRDASGTWTPHLTGILADWCAIRIQKMGRSPILYLVTQEGTSIVEYESTTSGATFPVSTALHSTGTPRYPTIEVELDGVRYVYWVNNASAPYIVQGLIRDRAGNTLFSVGTVLSGIDDAPIAVRKQTGLNGVPVLYLQAIVGGVLTEYSSTDGRTFT